MSIVNVRAALETKLNGMTPAIPTVWENINYTPVAGTPYQAAYLLPATPDNPTLGDGFYREQGIFQISLFYPLGTPTYPAGSSAAAARAQLIRTTFKRGTSMVSGSVTVRIATTPEISPGRVDGDRFSIPVKIRFFAEVYA